MNSNRLCFAADRMLNDLDSFLGNLTGEDKSYLGRLTVDNLISLKQALSSINGLITIAVSKAFVRELRWGGVISDEACEKALGKLSLTSPYGNGFDIIVEGHPFIIAEVKCNLPVGGNSFGAAQRNGLLKDVRNLAYPCRKQKNRVAIPENHLKFLAVLATGDEGQFVQALEKVVSKAAEIYPTEIETAEELSHCRPGTIYVVTIKSSDINLE